MDEFTHDDFEQFLNDEYPSPVVFGVRMGYGTIARRCDPILFVEQYWAFVHAQREELTD